MRQDVGLRCGRLRRALVAGGCALLAAGATPAAGAAGTGAAGTPGAAGAPGRPGVSVVVLDGRGFGHGVGLAQDGALSMGRAGSGTVQILGQFYPGTSLARAGGQVRVQVLSSAGPTTTVGLPSGGQILDAESGQQSPGFPVQVPPGGQVALGWGGGRYTATVLGGGGAGASARAVSPAVTLPPLPPIPTTTTTTSPGSPGGPGGGGTGPLPGPGSGPGPGGIGGSTTTTTAAPASGPPAPGGGGSASSARPLWVVPADGSVTAVVATGRRYRGVVEAVGDGAGLGLVNQLDVETYLRGMAEVQDPSWPLTSMQAQVIVERTYALRGMAAAGEICDDTRCQVYVGQSAEYPAQDRAVTTTAGYVLTYGGSLAATVFSANGGGFSASPEEGFGAGAGQYPYLRAARYYTTDPDPWTITVALGAVAARMGYPGTLTSARVSSVGPSGRALTVTLEGSAGPVVTSGIGFAASMGLRSNLFDLFDAVQATAPPAPPPAETLQALPSDSSALRAAVGAPAVVGAPRAPSALTGTRTGPPGESPLRWAGVALLVLVAAGAFGAWRRTRVL